jgi:hypothetical protein
MNNKNIADAIIDYKNNNGRFWKSKLHDFFYSGMNRSPELQQFRNYHISLLNKMNGNTTKSEIYELFSVNETINLNEFCGKYLPESLVPPFRTLDGSDVAKWLEKMGENVVSFGDKGRYGQAITESGYSVSTNGYVCLNK